MSAETLDLGYLDEPSLDVHHRDQVVDERNLECGISALDYEAVLGGSVVDGYDAATIRPHLQSDQVDWPELTLAQFPPLGHPDFLPPDLLRPMTVGYTLERNLRAFLAVAQSAHGVRAVIDTDGRARVEMPQVLRLGVEAEKTVEAVGLAQPADDDTGALSRGTRPQR